MLNFNCNSSQGLQKTDSFNNDKISASSLESFMFFDSNSGINITSNDARCLVALSSENVVMIVGDTLFDGDL